MSSRLGLGVTAFGLLMVFGALTPASAVMTMDQARAYCMKRAQANASANRQQVYADRCVQVLVSEGKAK